jgi:hypothetical protein
MHPEQHPVPGARVSGSMPYARSRQMIECLRADFLYTEKRARDLLFQVIPAAITARPRPILVAQLIRTAAVRAGRRAAGLGFGPANWHIASRATVHAMLAAGALLRPDGSTIPRTPSAQSSEVAALRPNFADFTEAHLIEYLIRKLGDITPRDHIALAHALFRQFDASIPIEQLEARVTALLATLSHRITLTASGAYFALA